MGTTRGVIEGDTGSLDTGSCGLGLERMKKHFENEMESDFPPGGGRCCYAVAGGGAGIDPICWRWLA